MGFIVFCVIMFVVVYLINESIKDSKNTTQNLHEEQRQSVPKESMPISRNVSPTGRNLNWNNYGDICFAIGSFVEGTNANGFVMVAENGKLIFHIRNFSKSYSTIGDKVPSDVIDFLFSNPSILKESFIEGHGTIYKLEFEISYAKMNQKTHEDAKKTVVSTAQIVSACISDGANCCAELLGKNVSIHIQEETFPYALHINLKLNR